MRVHLKAFLDDTRKWTANDQANTGSRVLELSPRFYVVKDGQLIAVAAGPNGWQHEIEPLLVKLGKPAQAAAPTPRGR